MQIYRDYPPHTAVPSEDGAGTIGGGGCTVEGCTKPLRALGMYGTHYARFRRNGTLEYVTVARPAVDRVMEKVVYADDGCWLFTGARVNGYGHVRGEDGRLAMAHRVVFLASGRTIPDGLDLDHRCHSEDKECKGGPTCVHRACVNPDHLEPVTRQENVLRGRLRDRWQNNTECGKGHSLEDAYRYGNRRQCRTCTQERERSRRLQSAGV